MVINFRELINLVERYNMKKHIPENVDLIFDINGFRFSSEDKTLEKELNKKHSMFIKALNKESFVEEFLTAEEISNHLKVSRQTVLNLLKSEDSSIRYIMLNKSYRVFASDYKNFLERNYNK